MNPATWLLNKLEFSALLYHAVHLSRSPPAVRLQEAKLDTRRARACERKGEEQRPR